MINNSKWLKIFHPVYFRNLWWNGKLRTKSLNNEQWPGFILSKSRLQNAIYFSIIAMPKKSHFTVFATQTFEQNTKNTCEFNLHCWDHVCKVSEWCLVDCFNREFRGFIVCIGVSIPHPPSFLQSPLKSANCPSPPSWTVSLLYWFFVNPPSPLKVGFFSEPSKYSKFFILQTILFLKVTKFLGKISQFEFLVMT